MPAMRLRSVSHFDADIQTKTLLLSLPRLRRLPASARRAVPQPPRQDYLDEFVWREIVRLLEDPALVQAEIDRRVEAARNADPLRQRQQHLRQHQTRLQNGIERLLTAYQEELLSLAQLRQRMPALRKQQQGVDSELESLEFAAADRSRYLRLTENLTEFCTKLRTRAQASRNWPRRRQQS